jgi:hypothetical protein
MNDILSRIAGRLTGIEKEDLTTAESQIADELIREGYLVFDDTDVLKPITNRFFTPIRKNQ